MRKFALFFMLALTISVIAVLSEPVFAEEMAGGTTDETTADSSADQTTGEEMAGGTTDETTADSSADQTMNEEMTASSANVEATPTKSHVDSPLMQLSMGVDPHQIQCGEGHKLVFKASNWSPSCVKESSFQTLLAWGWIANHDPSHEDLTKMMDEHMAKYPKETETQPPAENPAPVDSTNDTSKPKSQSHTINLSESMDMGAQ